MTPITRRTLMGTPSASLPASAAAAPDDQLGTAIMGTARSHAPGHLEAVRESRNYRLVGVAEPDASLLENANPIPDVAASHGYQAMTFSQARKPGWSGSRRIRSRHCPAL